MFDGLGAIGIAHMQQRIVAAVPPVMLDIKGSAAKDVWIECSVSMVFQFSELFDVVTAAV